MSKKHWLISTVMIVAMLAAVSSAAGCSKNSGAGQEGNAPAVTTDNAQPTGGSAQQQPGGEQPAQSGQQPANGQPTRNMDSQQMQADMKKALSELVTKGTITQDQADKVIQAFSSNKPGQGGQGQKTLDQLVTDGTLTQEQLDAVNQALPKPQNKSGGPAPDQTKKQ